MSENPNFIQKVFYNQFLPQLAWLEVFSTNEKERTEQGGTQPVIRLRSNHRAWLTFDLHPHNHYRVDQLRKDTLYTETNYLERIGESVTVLSDLLPAAAACAVLRWGTAHYFWWMFFNICFFAIVFCCSWRVVFRQIPLWQCVVCVKMQRFGSPAKKDQYSESSNNYI